MNDPVLMDLLLTDVARDAGITHRQADHWVNSGYINTTSPNRPGSGNPRTLTTHEARILHTLARMVSVGFTPARAAPLARTMTNRRRPIAELGAGLAIIDTRADNIDPDLRTQL